VAVRDAPNDEALDRQAWVYSNSRAVLRAPAPPAVQATANALGRAGRSVEHGASDDLRLRVEPAYDRAGRRAGAVVVGISLLPYEHTKHIVLGATLLIDAFVLIAGALLVRRAVGTALLPVADMTARAADWSEHDLDRRFNQGPPHDELTSLSATLDAMLARIGSSLRHEQRFSAEVAHELRTPLAGMRGEAELAQREPGLTAETRESLERIVTGTQRMEAVIETLLAAARSATNRSPGSSDAAEAAGLATEALRPAAERAGIALDVNPAPGRLSVGADADLVAQALHPLLDNALRHARSEVSVGIVRANGEVFFNVRDDGSGVPADEAEFVFEPGSGSSGSAGLGLPLARRLARTCGGDVDVVPSPEGGHFVLHLPVVA
jgi:signal transduction histidine kinase